MKDAAQESLHFAAHVNRDVKRDLRLLGAKNEKQVYLAFAPRVRHMVAKTGKTVRSYIEENRYETFSKSLYTYQTVDTALRFAGSSTSSPEQRALFPPVVVFLRPDELEPVNIPAHDRIEFYKTMILTWCDRLFAAGLLMHEVATYAEAIMLDMELRMKTALAKEAL